MSERCQGKTSQYPSPLRALLLAALVAFATGPATASADLPRSWKSIDGNHLPFTSEDQVLDFLRTARVIYKEPIGRGISGSLKLTLEQDGTVAHAAFRTIDLQLPPRHSSDSRPNRFTFRDSYVFEVAAYRLNRLFGLDRVPPTVLRTIGGEKGSVQLWVEDGTTEAALIRRGVIGQVPQRQLQKHVMLVFDQLIYNFDRHQANMLYDSGGRLWFIDHTRSFKKLPELSERASLAVCERRFLERLRSVSDRAIKQELRGLLSMFETDALIKRRRQLVERIDQLIAERGEEGVIYELARLTPPAQQERVAVTDLLSGPSGDSTRSSSLGPVH